MLLNLLTYFAAAPPADGGSDLGLWIFLAVVIGAMGWIVRSISRTNYKELERSAGPETEAMRRLKREEREARKAEAEAEAEAEAAAPAPGRPGEKKRRKGKKGRPAPKKGKPEPAAPPEPEPEPEKPDLLLPEGKALSEGLGRTRNEGFVGRLKKVFGGKQIDAKVLDEVEEVLFTADIGVKTSQKLLDELRAKLKRDELSDASKIWTHLKGEASEILGNAEGQPSLEGLDGRSEPYVVLVIGVNGAGKTTTIGKLAHRMAADGRKVLVGAGDTFRAAAVEQLGVWANRVGAEVVEGEGGQDPSSVLFDAVQKARDDGIDVVLLDTAGRLHTNANLVEELKKVRRVVGKALDGAPHEVLLVLDATNGQNAIAQAHTFGEALDVSGIALTKLDGTAKGGVILGICDELKIPIRWIGIGERTEDLRRFDRGDFVDALFDGV